MNAGKTQDAARAARGHRWPAAALAGIALLRIAIGWHFLYEGLTKLFDPAWSAAGYLRSAQWLLAGVFHWMADTPRVLAVVDFLNVWGLILIGAALLLGVFTRAGALAGALLLTLYYLAHPSLPGLEQATAEGSYLIVNKNVVELCALLLLAFAPGRDFAGLGPYLAAGLRRVLKMLRGRAEGAGQAGRFVEPEGLSRRDILAGLTTVPVVGAFVLAVLRSRAPASAEEQSLQRRLASTRPDAVSGPSVKIPQAQSLDELKGQVPHARLGRLEISRLILGGNLMNGFAHARDLIYVSPLVKAYHTVDKVLETLWLAEQCGINGLIINTHAGGRFVEAYQRRKVGRMNFIAQCRSQDLMPRVQRAIELGCGGAYIQFIERLVEQQKFDEINACLELMRRNGLVAGIGSHFLAAIKKCAEQGIEPDFCMKTFHHDNYWSARPGEQQHDNRYCDDREETIEFMRSFQKPWIAFKVLAAGAIHPRDGFRFAFENGADFICVGVYDFQVVEDANIAHDILRADLKRQRPWRAEVV